jgi:rubrerythrin
VYSRLAKVHKDPKNRDIIRKIADEEMEHYEFWKKYTDREMSPKKWQCFKFFWISRIFGMTFGIKLMEKGEANAKINYGMIEKKFRMQKRLSWMKIGTSVSS